MISISDTLANSTAMQSCAQDGSRPRLYCWMHRPSLRITDPELETQGRVGIPHDVKWEVEQTSDQVNPHAAR